MRLVRPDPCPASRQASLVVPIVSPGPLPAGASGRDPVRSGWRGGIVLPRAARQGARQVLLLGGGAAGGQALAVLSAPLLTRLFDAGAFGAFGAFTAVSGLLAATSTLRFDQAVLLDAEEDRAADVLRLCAACVLLASLAGAVIACAWVLARPGVTPLGWSLPVLLSASILSLGLAQALQAWSTRHERFRAMSAFQTARTAIAVLLQGAAGLLLALPALLVAGQVAGQALACAGLARAGGWDALRLLRSGWSRARLREAAGRHRGFVLWGAPQVLLRLGGTALPVLLLPWFFGDVEGGLFWLAYRMLILPGQVLVESLRPVFFRKAAILHREGADLRRPAWRLAGLVALLCAPAALALCCAGPWMFALVFGRSWRGAGVDAALIAVPWCLEMAQMPSAVLVAVLGRQRGYLLAEAASVAGRALGLVAGGLLGSATLAVSLYALAWGATSLGVIAWIAGPAGAATRPVPMHRATASPSCPVSVPVPGGQDEPADLAVSP